MRLTTHYHHTRYEKNGSEGKFSLRMPRRKSSVFKPPILIQFQITADRQGPATPPACPACHSRFDERPPLCPCMLNTAASPVGRPPICPMWCPGGPSWPLGSCSRKTATGCS